MLTRKSTARVAAVVAAALLVLVAGCSGGNRPAAGGPSSAPPTVTISLTGNYLSSYAPLWAAAPEMSAIESKYGTRIAYASFGKGSDALTALLGGSAQICNCAFSTGYKAAVQGQPVHYVANMFVGGGTVLVADKRFEAQRGTSVAAFDGATWGYASEGSISQIGAVALARQAGLDWQKQKGVAVGSIAAFEPALRSGRVDLAMMDTASAAQSVAEGVGYPVVNTNDITAFGPAVGTLLGNGFVVTDEFRTAYPDLSQALVNALVAGLNRIRAQADPVAARAALPAEFQKAHEDVNQFATEWRFSQPSFLPTDGTSGEQAVLDTTTTGGFTDADRSAAGAKAYVDNSMVEKAYQQLGLARPTVQTAS